MNSRLTTYSLGTLFALMAAALPSIASNTGHATFAENTRITLEIADTPNLRAQGLMRRNQMNKQHGMLFVFPETGLLRVWMKDTFMALDVIFLAEDGKIVSMLEHLPPCLLTPCPIYDSQKNARYMLELSAGFIAEHGIQIGQDVMLDYQHVQSQ